MTWRRCSTWANRWERKRLHLLSLQEIRILARVFSTAPRLLGIEANKRFVAIARTIFARPVHTNLYQLNMGDYALKGDYVLKGNDIEQVLLQNAVKKAKSPLDVTIFAGIVAGTLLHLILK